MDKELIRGRGGQHQARIADLVARVRFHTGEGFVLVHIEHQARRDRAIGLRLFLYAAWLIERYKLPVYPILLTSYDTPRTAEPDRFAMGVRGYGVLDFRFRVVQLNRMNWRDFVRHPNAVATALMARMNIQPRDRPKALVQMMRLFSTMRVDPEKVDVIITFVGRYLALTAKQTMAFHAEVDNIHNTDERHDVMKLMAPWRRMGLEEGRIEGRVEGELAVIKRLLARRIGALAPATERKLGRLNLAQLETLSEALLDFTSSRELERWLATERELVQSRIVRR